MVTRVGRLILAGLVAWTFGCGESTQAPSATVERPPALQFFETDAGISVARDGAARQLLADDGRGYEVHASTDGRWIALDVALFSNLQTTRLMRWDVEAEAYVDSINLSQVAWERVLEARAIGLEQIENPRTRFESWSGDGSGLMLEVSGFEPGGAEIREILTIPLR